MIPLREVIAWRAHAPWADDQMVEQDYLISRAVEHIFSHPKLSRQLATVLRTTGWLAALFMVSFHLFRLLRLFRLVVSCVTPARR